jgi:hypothetical protein
MEPAGDMERHEKVVSMSEEQYHDLVSRELVQDPPRVAAMGTAANMNYLSHRRAEFHDLRVDAFVNCGRRG